MATGTKEVSEKLTEAAVTGKTQQIKIAGVQALEARARKFKDIDAVYALKYVVDEGDPPTGNAALKALRRLANE